MKLGKRAKYSVRLMVGIGRSTKDNKPVSLRVVARNSGISRRYLDQLAISLKNASLLRSRPGRGGGYTLARPAEQISIGDIIEAAVGPINISECVMEPEDCLQSEYCSCRLLWSLVHQRLASVLSKFTLADLLVPHGSEMMQLELQELDSHGTETSPSSAI